MELYAETYYCEECGRAEHSSVGNPLYTFGTGRNERLVCLDCYNELTEEEENDEQGEV